MTIDDRVLRPQRQRSDHRPFPIHVTLGFTISVAFLAAASAARAATTNPLVVTPYDGQLQNDGAPASDGPYDMRFSLWDNPLKTGTALWSSTYCSSYGGTGTCNLQGAPAADNPAVDVSAGHFSVLLGTNPAFPLAVRTAPELYLEVEVEGVDLGGLQRLGAAPSAGDGIVETFTSTNGHQGYVKYRNGTAFAWHKRWATPTTMSLDTGGSYNVYTGTFSWTMPSNLTFTSPPSCWGNGYDSVSGGFGMEVDSSSNTSTTTSCDFRVQSPSGYSTWVADVFAFGFWQ